ncbi:solute carrier family 2, facilitated glucose transporter member 10-like isoform X2 [Tigriopus californicus]|uniref:solute carrier family 2, facilitated glucose transporter member 10-like isoform X2 n=2 Tax=Tigriopus californicus TaxID=6832 RepID=UPI0027DA21EC|nr:solute carrier family 2, facilitated glucose transporter member 10-like isoform X2 [Tigriopus californicus]
MAVGQEDRENLLGGAQCLELEPTLAAHNVGDTAMLADGDDDLDLPQPSRTSPGSSRDAPAIVYVAATTAALGGLLFGYDIGVISGAKGPMRRELDLTCSQLEAVVAFLPLGACLASLVGGNAIDHYGRKFTIIFNAFLFTAGSLTVTLSSHLGVILFGRFMLGFAVSLSAIAECIYISEIVRPEKRGMFVSLNELTITVGILMAYLVNYMFAATPHGWRLMFLLSAFVAVAQGILMFFMPKTPHFLMLCQREKRAEAAIRRLELSHNVRQTMTDIRLGIQEASSNSFYSVLCQNKDNMASRLLIGFGLVFFQQFTGQPNIIYYANDVFYQVGFCDEWSSTLASVGLGLMKVVSTIVSLTLVDRIGRRKALMGGISMMMISVLGLSIHGFYTDSQSSIHIETCSDYGRNATNQAHLFLPRNESAQEFSVQFEDSVRFANQACRHSVDDSVFFRYAAFGALVLFVCAYSFSFGPITWVLLSEIFPPAVKGRAMAFATSLNWLGNFVVSGTFLQAVQILSLGGVYFVYFILCGCSIAFVYFLVPETKNRTLEEISKELRLNSFLSFILNKWERFRKRCHGDQSEMKQCKIP